MMFLDSSAFAAARGGRHPLSSRLPKAS